MTEQPETGNCFFCGWHTTEIIGWWCEDDWGRRDCAKSPTGLHITYPLSWVEQGGLTPHPRVRQGEEVDFLPLPTNLFAGWDDPRPTSECLYCNGTGKADDHNDCGFCYPDAAKCPSCGDSEPEYHDETVAGGAMLCEGCYLRLRDSA